LLRKEEPEEAQLFAPTTCLNYHEQAVADGVNVGFDLYRIRTLISEQGSTVNDQLTKIFIFAMSS
jgi:type I site-specific restriction endonuclease